MKLPIQYASIIRNAVHMPDGKSLDFYELAQITFEKPDMETFFGLNRLMMHSASAAVCLRCIMQPTRKQ